MERVNKTMNRKYKDGLQFREQAAKELEEMHKNEEDSKKLIDAMKEKIQNFRDILLKILDVVKVIDENYQDKVKEILNTAPNDWEIFRIFNVKKVTDFVIK